MTGRRLVLELVADHPAVFSRTPATLGAHSTLPGPTGASLLGWAASRLYSRRDPDGAFTLFHSGAVRFSDAVRMSGDKPLFPNPATLLEPKHGDGRAALGRAAFHAHADNEGRQAEAVRNRLVTLDGEDHGKASRRRRLRTALDHGRAADGQLFDYEEVLPDRLVLRATVETDAGIDAALWARLEKAFEGTLRLGRARNNGYGGGYRCTALDDAASPWPQPPEVGGRHIRLWLLSDLALSDDCGSPRLLPEPADFDLGPEWALDPSESALSVRRIWPYNRAFGSRDMEFPVIEAGSVLAFARAADAGSPVQLSGIAGIARERGCGRYTVLDKFDFRPCKDDEVQDPFAGSAPPPGIAAWASARAGSAFGDARKTWRADRKKEALGRLRRAGLDGPGPSQWSRLEREALPALGEKRLGELLQAILDRPWSAHDCGLDRWVRRELFVDDPDDRDARRADIRDVLSALRIAAQQLRSRPDSREGAR
jgi:hypothetical protein